MDSVTLYRSGRALETNCQGVVGKTILLPKLGTERYTGRKVTAMVLAIKASMIIVANRLPQLAHWRAGSIIRDLSEVLR